MNFESARRRYFMARRTKTVYSMFSCALTVFCLLPIADSHAAALEKNAPSALAMDRSPACVPLYLHIGWHEPFLGLSTWSEAASEALAHASKTCREAIAAGKVPQVAKELSN